MIDATTAYELIVSIIAILGVVGTYITSSTGKQYLTLIRAVLSLLGDYYDKIRDGTITDEEYMEIGKDFVAVAKLVDADAGVPATIKQE